MLTSGFSHVYLAISQKSSSWIPQNITQSWGFVFSKRENTKINLGELFVFKTFLCCEANHPEPSVRALPVGFSKSLRLASVLTLAGMCELICFCLFCTEPVVRWAARPGQVLFWAAALAFSSFYDFVFPSARGNVCMVGNPMP